MEEMAGGHTISKGVVQAVAIGLQRGEWSLKDKLEKR